MNQSVFGEKVGVLQKTQSFYEKGTRKPDSDYMEAAASIGVDVQYVITGQRSTVLQGAHGARIAELLSLYEKANPAMQQAVINLLKAK